MSTGESFESRFEKIDVTLKDPKSEVNVDCLLVSELLKCWQIKPASLDKSRALWMLDAAVTKENSTASSS